MRFFLGPPPKSSDPNFAVDMENWLLRLVDELKRIEANLDVQWLPTKDTDDLAEGTTNLYFTTERSQDAVGSILKDTASVDLTYDDIAPSISGVVLPAGIDHALLGNLNSASYTHLTAINHTDLTDGGETILHTHAGVSTSNVTGPAVSIDGDVAVFDGITGKIIKDSGIHNSNLFLLSGRVANQVVTVPDAALIPLTLRTVNSQTADSQQWQRSDAQTVAVMDKDGNLGLGLSVDPEERIHARASASDVKLRLDTYVASGSGGVIDLRRAKGTLASPAAADSGACLGVLGARGLTDALTWAATDQAKILFFASEDVTAANQGSRITFQTTKKLTATVREVMRLNDVGSLLLGTVLNPTTMEVGISLGQGVAPTDVADNCAALYTADAYGVDGNSFLHAMGQKDSAYLLMGLRFTDGSGVPSATGAHEGAFEYNLADNALYARLETAWHAIVLADSTNYTDLTDGGATTLHKHDHGGQDGLADDDHVGYARLTGRSGGQSWTAGTGAGDDMTLSSTVHATKGNIFLGAYSTYDEVNSRLGIGTLTPSFTLDISGTDTTRIIARITNLATTGTYKNLDFGVCGDVAFGLPLWVKAGYIESATDGGLVLGAYAGNLSLYANPSRLAHMTIVNPTGYVGIGLIPTEKFHVLNGNALFQMDGAICNVSNLVYGTGSSYYPAFIGGHAEGSLGSPGATAAGTAMVKFIGKGWDGDSWEERATISMIASALHSATEGGSKIKFRTTLEGAIANNVRFVMDEASNFQMGIDVTPSTGLPSMVGGMAMKTTTVPSSVATADVVTLYTADVNGAAVHSWWHGMGEDGQVRVIGSCIIKSNAGDPDAAVTHESAMCINTNDNTLKVYADGGWRSIATW